MKWAGFGVGLISNRGLRAHYQDWVFALLLLACPATGAGQVNGHVSLLVDDFPDISAQGGNQHVTEARLRLFAEHKRDVGEHLKLNLSGYIDGLFANRGALGARTARDVVVRPADLYAEVVTRRFEIRAGASRLVWGRLDEFQPTDVVNPIDLARFLLEGRSEARLSVGLVRGRIFLPASTTLELVVVPAFRAGRFDQLDEPTSPFNLTLTAMTNVGVDVTEAAAALRQPTVIRYEPSASWQNMQGGGRVTSTAGRVDWGVSAYRGLKSFPIVTVTPIPDPRSPIPDPDLTIVETFPRFTMIGGDFETVRGPWGVRGEVAAFVDDELQSTRAARGVSGKSFQGGIGVDRRAGDYRVAANVLVSHRAAEESADSQQPAATGGVSSGSESRSELERTDLMLVGAVDRSFARETRTLRVFTVYDPTDETMFVRVIAAVSLHDNVWLEGSGGLFAGSSLDTIGRLTRRDFVYGRLKVFF